LNSISFWVIVDSNSSLIFDASTELLIVEIGKFVEALGSSIGADF
jgi:hypothetical protein